VSGLPGKALETAKARGHFISKGWRVRKNGSRFWASTVLQYVKNPAGELVGFAKITRDITERMKRRRRCSRAKAASGASFRG
jgi:PAS domain S-box-containing protein